MTGDYAETTYYSGRRTGERQVVEDVAMRDFSLPMEPKRFRLDPDVFEAPPMIPGGQLKRILAVYRGIKDLGDDIEAILASYADAFRLMMPGPQGERFAARLLTEGGPDDPPPISMNDQAVPVLLWLLEEYGMRPTQPSSASANGPTGGTGPGNGSTDGASPTGSATT
jgi:hypothetical protein